MDALRRIGHPRQEVRRRGNDGSGRWNIPPKTRKIQSVPDVQTPMKSYLLHIGPGLRPIGLPKSTEAQTLRRIFAEYLS